MAKLNIIHFTPNRGGFIRSNSAYHPYVQNMSPARFSDSDTTEKAEERIRMILGLQDIYLGLIPPETATLLAEICEKYLCRFKCNLQEVRLSTGKWGGKYNPRTGRVLVSCQMNRGDTASVFIHEFGHALQSAMLNNPATRKTFRKELRRIRKDNLDLLKEIYRQAAEHEPKLTDIVKDLMPLGFDLVYYFMDGLEINAHTVPTDILDNFSRNLISTYALADSGEYFCEHFADYLFNPEPSVFTKRIWRLAETLAPETGVKTAPKSTWLDHVKFYGRQSVLLTTKCDTVVQLCDLQWNAPLPGLEEASAARLQKHIQESVVPGRTSRYPDPLLIEIPCELGMNFKRMLLVPATRNQVIHFYRAAIRAANASGIKEIVIQLYFDGRGTNFNRLVNVLKEVNRYMNSAWLPLCCVTFIASERMMIDNLAKKIPLTVEYTFIASEQMMIDNLAKKIPVTVEYLSADVNPTIQSVFQAKLDEIRAIRQQQIRDAILEARRNGTNVFRVKKRSIADIPPNIE